MLLIAVIVFWSDGSVSGSLNTPVAGIMIGSAAAIFLIYAIICLFAGCLVSRKAAAPEYVTV